MSTGWSRVHLVILTIALRIALKRTFASRPCSSGHALRRHRRGGDVLRRRKRVTPLRPLPWTTSDDIGKTLGLSVREGRSDLAAGVLRRRRDRRSASCTCGDRASAGAAGSRTRRRIRGLDIAWLAPRVPHGLRIRPGPWRRWSADPGGQGTQGDRRPVGESTRRTGSARRSGPEALARVHGADGGWHGRHVVGGPQRLFD